MAKKKVDNIVQNEKNIMNAGGLSPNMASFLINDANKIVERNPNYPEEHFVADKGGTFTDLGNPFDYRNPHR